VLPLVPAAAGVLLSDDIEVLPGPLCEPVESIPGVLVLVPPAPVPDAPRPVVPPVAEELVSPVARGALGALGVVVLEVGPTGAVGSSSRPQAVTESARATAAAI
jgi:hypothetical protein